MDLYLQGQSVAVIGAGNGIGRAIAMGFVAEGCQVYGFDRDVKAATVPGMKALVTGDVSKLDEVRAFADQMGEADHVIFCVGIGSGKFGFPFWNLDPADWIRVLEINLVGAVNVAHAFAPKLITRNKGSMLFLVSVAGQIGSQTDPPYSASKAGVIALTKSLAKEVATKGVLVNAVAPAAAKTAMFATMAQTHIDYMLSKIPMGRFVEVDEIAAMVSWLSSEDCSFTTGSVFDITGGRSTY